MPKTKTPNKPKPFLSPWTMLAILLLLLTSGCVTQPKTLPPSPVRGVQLPPLPATARQATTPSVCSPTCSDALTKERESWRQSLTKAASVGSPASAPTTPPAKP